MNPTTRSRNYISEVFQNKVLIFFAILVTALCFGFTITHFSIGVDDVARQHYLYSTGSSSMIQQSRLLHHVINGLTGVVDWIPFFTEFVGAGLFCVSALLFCALLQTVCGGTLSTAALTAFVCVYISSSINVEKFLYHLDVIVVSIAYCFCALSLIRAHRCITQKDAHILPSIILEMLAVSAYESFALLYVCGVFSILILEILKDPAENSFPALLRKGLRYAAVLLAAVLLYYGIATALQILTGQYHVFSRYLIWEVTDQGLLGTLLLVLRTLFGDIAKLLREKYVPLLVFFGISLGAALLMPWLAHRRKNWWLLLCFLAMLLCNLLIYIIFGGFHPRIAQTMCFYDGFLILLAVQVFWKSPAFRKWVICAVSLLVLVQSADMNRWFYNDYVRYEKESFVVHTLATKLLDSCDLSKPVVFTNCATVGDGYLNTHLYEGGDANGNSVIYWCSNTALDFCPNLTSELFRLHGYDFIRPATFEQAARANQLAKGMPVWPQEGCIREFDDVIAVNFG